MRRHAFTLIELLTVIAITAVLLTLVILPVFQSFNLTRAAQGYSDAQNKARQLVEGIAREISNSAGVRDNAGVRGMINVTVPGENGNPVVVGLPWSKLDLIKPAEGDPTNVRNGALVNPKTGRADPTLRAPKGQVVLPVGAGATVVRYFIGLRDPFAAYYNPYDGLLMQRGGGRDNLFVLYRVEVEPYIWIPGANPGDPPQYVVNNQFFFDQDRDNDPTTSGPLLDDPNFFDPNVALPAYTVPRAGDADKPTMVQNWRARATIVTELSRYDMIQPLVERRQRRVVYDANVPRLIPLVQFRPAGIGNEPAEGQGSVRLSEEHDNPIDTAPDVLRTKFGAWSTLLVRMWPTQWNPNAPGAYTVGRNEPVTNRFQVVYFDPNVNTNERTDGIPMFDSTGYLESVGRGDTFPFSRNLIAGGITPTTSSLFVPYVADFKLGRITTSFGIDEIGNIAGPPRLDLNPTSASGAPNSPANAGTLGGNWDDPIYSPSSSSYEINTSFNKMYQEQTTPGSPIAYGLQNGQLHRFVDLRVVPFSDGTISPLHPNLGFARARIVPGSEVVIGPDQQPGPNYGQPVRYTRVTRTPGPNQYRINYTDLPEPTNPATGQVDYSVQWPGMPNPSPVYSANDFPSAIIQPRFKTGYVQLYSDPNVPLPQGNIVVSYRFQFNRPGDIFSADYDSRQIMNVSLTIRNYPQTSIPNPQQVTLQASATVRNVLR